MQPSTEEDFSALNPPTNACAWIKASPKYFLENFANEEIKDETVNYQCHSSIQFHLYFGSHVEKYQNKRRGNKTNQKLITIRQIHKNIQADKEIV